MSDAPAGPCLSPTDRASCAVCADWLATAPQWAWVAAPAALLCWAGVARGGTAHALWLLGALLLAERVLAVRVALDARLFDRLADGRLEHLGQLDAGLHGVLRVPTAKAGRPLAPRIAGAMRLYRWHACACAAMVLPPALSWF